MRVIGRIVCFLDPVLGSWAWENERAEMVVLQGSGGPLETDYGPAAFTNVASPEVRQYLIDLSVEAAGLGFDEILYDYVRRPEGDSRVMYFPGLVSAPDVAVARFVADTNTQLADTDALLGVSVFGIAATRPEQIAQDIRLLAPHVDYVAPMVYPSHWGPGEYDVADPNRQPTDIVGASIADFQAVVAGSGAAVVPWLQDFSAGGVEYGPAEVRAQIDAALDAGAPGFLLWNAGSFYTAGALQPPVSVSAARIDRQLIGSPSRSLTPRTTGCLSRSASREDHSDRPVGAPNSSPATVSGPSLTVSSSSITCVGRSTRDRRRRRFEGGGEGTFPVSLSRRRRSGRVRIARRRSSNSSHPTVAVGVRGDRVSPVLPSHLTSGEPAMATPPPSIDRAAILAGLLPVLDDVEVDLRGIAPGVVELQRDGERLVGDELLVGAHDGRPALVALDP